MPLRSSVCLSGGGGRLGKPMVCGLLGPGNTGRARHRAGLLDLLLDRARPWWLHARHRRRTACFLLVKHAIALLYSSDGACEVTFTPFLGLHGFGVIVVTHSLVLCWDHLVFVSLVKAVKP